jgi:hypothetical protein
MYGSIILRGNEFYMKNALFFDVRIHHHAYMFREALVGRNNSNVSFSLPLDNCHQLSLENAYEYAKAQGIDFLYLCTLDGNVNLKLIYILLRAEFSHSVYIITNLFAYHKLNVFGLKSLLLIVLLFFSSRLIVLTSDPLLETRIYFPLLRRKLTFAPDFYLDREQPDSFKVKVPVLPFEAPRDAIVISFLGNLNNKKYATELFFTIISLQSLLQSLGIFFIIAGNLSSDIPLHLVADITTLATKRQLVFMPKYISDDIFYNILSQSSYSWCLQKSFSASSGIFTRSCAFGVPPLVAKGTVLDIISARFNLGHSLRPSDIAKDLILFCLTSSNKSVYQKKSSDCKKYAARCSESDYRKTVHSIINGLK